MKKTTILIAIVALASVWGCSSEADEAYERIEMLSENDRQEDVIVESTKAIETFPDDPRFYYKRGWVYHQQDRNEKAQQDFEKCLVLDAEYGDAYKGIAGVYADRGMYDLAKKNYEKAIEFAPNDKRKAAYYENLGNMYSSMGEYEKAIFHIQQAIALYDIGDYYYNLGGAYIMNGDEEKGLEQWKAAIAEDNFREKSFKGEILLQLAIDSYRNSEYRQAKAYLEQALEVDPSDERYLEAYAEVKSLVE